MADTAIRLGRKDIDDIISDYAAKKALTENISVEFSGLNELDTLTLLKTMSIKEPSVTDLAPVCEIMLDGRQIKFIDGEGNEFHPVAYNRGNGNSLHLMFKDAPYLYDTLQETIYALLLKKLTPHLVSSN